jgi:RNA polymerase sigma-70 factor, ECF subfamily
MELQSKKAKPLNSTFHKSEAEILREQEWILAARKDPEAFGKLYDRYFEGVFQFVYRRTGDEQLSGDLTSQTFLKALQNLKRYEDRGLPFSAWLYRIASNEINKHYRRTNARMVFSLEEAPMLRIMQEAGHELEEEEREEQLQQLVTFLRELSAEDVMVLELRFFEEKSFKEIAYILEVSESGAKMRTYRALERLKKIKDVRQKTLD